MDISDLTRASAKETAAHIALVGRREFAPLKFDSDVGWPHHKKQGESFLRRLFRKQLEPRKH